MSQLVPRGPASLDRLEDYDANMYSDWSRDDKRMLVSLDGLLTGVQTPTTHTLTPATTLSAIIDMEQSEESYHNEAGFVPPVISAQQASTYLNMVDTKSWQGGSATVTTMPPLPTLAARTGVTTTSALSVNIPSGLPTSLPTAVVAPTPASATTPTRRNVGGRRPNKAKGISPEEEERRQVRRERNKAAAARCRKRRMDHTNALIKETEGLEHKKQGLQSEIQDLNEQLEELTYILEAHRATGTCRHTSGVTVPVPRPESPPDIKPVVLLPPEPLRIKQEVPPAATSNFVFEQPPPAKRPMLAMTTAAPVSVPPPAPVSAMAPITTPTTSVSITKPLRPTSLPVPPHIILKTNTTASEVAGITISTPSTGIPFNFDSLMEGGTGLTPVSGPLVPSCSSQQRNHNSVDMASPDASIGNKLVSL